MSEPEKENSEENQNQKGQKIKIEIDRSAELEKFYSENKELERKNAELENQLTESAKKMLSEKAQKYGIPEDDPDILEKVKASELVEKIQKESGEIHAPRGGSTPNFYDMLEQGEKREEISPITQDILNRKLDDVPIDLLKWSSEQACVEGLKAIANNSEDSRRKQAQNYLNALARKLILNRNAEFQFEGKLSELGKSDSNKSKKKGSFKKIGSDEE